jgi:hypothetical protein
VVHDCNIKIDLNTFSSCSNSPRKEKVSGVKPTPVKTERVCFSPLWSCRDAYYFRQSRRPFSEPRCKVNNLNPKSSLSRMTVSPRTVNQSKQRGLPKKRTARPQSDRSRPAKRHASNPEIIKIIDSTDDEAKPVLHGGNPAPSCNHADLSLKKDNDKYL